LAIEIDGSEHFTKKGIHHDQERDAYLNSLMIKVIRFSSVEAASNIDGIAQNIFEMIQEMRPHPNLPLKGEGISTPHQKTTLHR
jgi:very-short-patch-repair endonuclease